MIILTKDEVLHLHEKLINSTGGLAGVRDIDALESSIINCMQTFDDKDLYPISDVRLQMLDIRY